MREKLTLPRIFKRRIKDYFFKLCVLVVLFIIIGGAFSLLRPGIRLRVDAETVAAFRVPHRAIGMLQVYAERNSISFPELFVLFNAENDFFPEKLTAYDLSAIERLYISDFKRLLRRYNTRSIAPFVAMYENLFSEIEVFPIPDGWYEYDPSIMFGDSWGVEHNFQGRRMHMGTAIIDRENIRGRVPVSSMTYGHVREAGWDNNLGYFVTIITKNDTLYLYAHLDSIATGIATGQDIAAGQTIGQMGNSGGGRGGRSFPVHLHLAISPSVTFVRGDFWINPYPLLRNIAN
ncbi:MAG: M23 family metallopeptidase [Defluviitaleaceae bacterium]|nr:M23 family metallopeptidase [Defluviitaleaceae bacterium]